MTSALLNQWIDFSVRGRHRAANVVKVFGFALIFLCTAHAQADWGAWKDLGHGVAVRARCLGPADGSRGRYNWEVEFRNETRHLISFEFKLTPMGMEPEDIAERVTLGPGQRDTRRHRVRVTPDQDVDVWTDNWEN